MRMAVAGATGTVGRFIVSHARARGHDVSEIARSRGVDLLTGTGLEAAMEGIDVVVDAVSTATLKAAEAVSFFSRASGNLLSAASRAGVGHAVLLSIVGIDRNSHGYYAGKVAQEQLYRDSTVPSTTVRSTQFHEFAAQVALQTRLGPVQLAPRARVQPVAADEVAAHVVELAEGAPRGRAVDIAGPREEQLADMVRRATQRGSALAKPPRAVIAISVPTAQMRGMRAGLNLPGSEAQSIGPSFAQWLEAGPHT